MDGRLIPVREDHAWRLLETLVLVRRANLAVLWREVFTYGGETIVQLRWRGYGSRASAPPIAAQAL